MRYQVDLAEVKRGFAIFIPVAEQVQSIYEKYLEQGHQIGFPFWAKIWPAAKAMSLFLQKEPRWVDNKQVLEIGAGIGLPSFLIANRTKQVIISDYDNDAVALLKKNIFHLDLKNAEARCLDWNDVPEDILADTVLFSDINYDPEQFEALIHLINRFLSNGSTVIVTTPQRLISVPFAEAIKSSIQHSQIITIEENATLVDISLFVLR